MRSIATGGVLGLVLAVTIGAQVTEVPPPWAYGFAAPAGAAAAAPTPTPPPAPLPDDGTLHKLAGSSLSLTATQIRDGFGPADWFPNEHPKMPEIVAHGKKPDARACALCHYPNGKGRPENSGVSGLPVSYFIQTMNDFRSGHRKSADSRKANTIGMIAIAKAMTDEEIKASAEYYGSMAWTPWVKVVEATTVPKTRISLGMFIPLDSGDKEPIAQRIIEVPENIEATEVLRDPRAGFVAYVPVGSIKKGEALVTTGGGKTIRCAECHGADLQGLGPVPGIAGRSPSYLVRQMFDTKQGMRNGEWAALMKPAVARLTVDDMVAIAAYVASRPVGAAAKGSAAGLDR